MKRAFANEDGVALITALLAVVILGGLSAVFVARATTETRASGDSRDWEIAIHAAEAAADQQIAELNALDTHVTEGNLGPIAGPGPTDDEREWALGLLPQVRDSEAWLDLGEAEGYAVRPHAGGDPLEVIYAVGAKPSFDNPQASIRLIKMQVAQDNFIPRFALLTDGNLKFGGSARITSPKCEKDPLVPETCIADVHVNQGFTQVGGSSVIEGQVRIAGGSCQTSVTAVNGCVDSDVSPYPIPEFTARSFYMRDLDKLRSDPDPGRLVEWWDLCPDGTVKFPSAAGPCTGTQRWPDDETGNNFRGWDFKSAQNEWSSSNLDAGVFYVYRANASINGSAGDGQRAVSVIVEGGGTPNRSGNLEIKGNPALQAALPDVLFITDRDLDMGGTSGGGPGGGDGCSGGADYSGVIGVVEQLDVGGNVRLKGAMIVRDSTDESNKVQRNNAAINGNMCLEYDDNLAIDLTGIWVVTFWNEL